MQDLRPEVGCPKSEFFPGLSVQHILLILLFVFVFFPSIAKAENEPGAEFHALALKAIRQTVATAFSQTPLSIDQLGWVQSDRAQSGMKAEFIAGSTEYARVSESLVLMRAMTRVTSDSAGVVEYLGQAHPLRKDESSGKYKTEILTAVRTDASTPLQVRSAGVNAIFRIEFISKDEPSALGIDPSCSPYSLTARVLNPKVPKIFAIGCRDVHEFVEDKRRIAIEVEMDLGSRSSPVLIDGQVVPLEDGILRFRMNADTKSVQVKDPEAGEIEVTAQVPARYHYMNLGFGMGPYHQVVQAPNHSFDGTVALATLYGSYFVTESSRLVFFSATSVKSNFFTDNGLYFNSESFRVLDRRLSINVMLGFNVVGFGWDEASRFRLGFPQGIELIFRDAFQKNTNLQAGAFIYPQINDKAYYNIWLRYGRRGIFGEMNYISVRDTFGGIPVYTRNLGITVGFPIARFF